MCSSAGVSCLAGAVAVAGGTGWLPAATSPAQRLTSAILHNTLALLHLPQTFSTDIKCFGFIGNDDELEIMIKIPIVQYNASIQKLKSMVVW